MSDEKKHSSIQNPLDFRAWSFRDGYALHSLVSAANSRDIAARPECHAAIAEETDDSQKVDASTY
jgi:hypothetical protein